MFLVPDIPPRTNLGIQLENLLEAAGDAVFQLNTKGEILCASKRVNLTGTSATLSSAFNASVEAVRIGCPNR